MSENKFSDNEIVEPEGFWPDDRVPDDEPFETIPYTPDEPEFTHPEEPIFYEPPIEEPAYSVAHAQESTVAEDTPEEHREHSVADAQEQNTLGHAPDEWPSHSDADDKEPTATEDTPDEQTVDPIAASQEHSYAYHSSDDEEPLALDSMREFIDASSWLDDPPPEPRSFAPREYVPDTPDQTWQPQEQATENEPFSDPFDEKATEDYWVGQPAYSDPNAPVHYVPDTPDQTMRRSGLAWSAGIAFFGSVAFMLFLGWLADLLLGTSPWGMVGGIVLGSIIGFIQFFRISSQIYGTSNNSSDFRPLLSHGDDLQDTERPEPPVTPPLL